MRWLQRWRAMAREQRRSVLHRARAEAELDEEMRFHLEMEAETLARTQGLAPDEARRRAGVAFGGVQRFKEEVREARGLDWLTGMRLDFVLALRMLRKHAGLTLVGGLGLAVGIAVTVGFFAAMATFVFPTLPLDEGERIVAIENRDLDANDEDRRVLHDFVEWRQQLRTVQELGAFRTTARNLIPDDGAPSVVQLAEITATGFTVPRVPPLLGRPLLPADERPGAPPVLVIGHDVWRNRFGSDSAVLGRELRLDGVRHTIVGVMPAGFGWPASHSLWAPLRLEPAAVARRRGPELHVFGRLAPGVTMSQAQAELEAVGRRTASLHPDTHARLRPMVMPYVHALMDVQGVSGWMVASMQLVVSLLLVVVALNVAVLVYARTAMRQGELAVRTALGASRRRIVAQLFVEGLVLSLGAAVVGLGLAHVGMGLVIHVQTLESGRAFWVRGTLPASAVLFAVGVAVLSAVVVGVLPALQATGKRLQADLRQLGGGTGIRLGRTWTALVVAQVAIAVAALPVAVGQGWTELRNVATRPTYPIDEFLRAELGAGEPPAGTTAADSRADTLRFAARLSELLRRVEGEPEVAAATYWVWFPGRSGERLEVEGIPMPPRGHYAYSQGVAPNYLDTYGARILGGRSLDVGDAGAAGTAVVVNETFVRKVLGGQPALGRRMRYVQRRAAGAAEAQPGPWLHIVGVASDLQVNTLEPDQVLPEVFFAVAPEQTLGVSVEVRLQPGVAPADFTPRLRTLAVGVDPALRLGTTYSLAEERRELRRATRLIAAAGVVALLSVFLLSAAGVYALASVTVTRRRREIGIRAALGAPARRVLLGILARVARQVGIGLGVGLLGAAVTDHLSGGELMLGYAALLLPAFGVVMAIVALLGAFGPARRGLRIQPTEALRADA